MADPQVQSPMDFLDKLTVILYRAGFLFAAIGMLLLFLSGYWKEMSMQCFIGGLSSLFVGATLCASCLHIYVKKIRVILQAATWVALLLQVFGVTYVALGGILVTLSGLCVKEHFCFKIPLLKFMPILAVVYWVSNLFSGQFFVMDMLVAVTSLLSAILFAVLFIAKCRMPLHFDIGDKTKYQI